MKRTLHLVLAVAALALVACGEAEENNHGLKYDFLDVNFSATKAGSEWSEDDVVGVRATCTRNGTENVLMSANDPACFTPVAASQQAYLVKKSDGDNILALSGDHNYRFYAYTPYDASIKDFSKLPASIPDEVEFEEPLQSLYVADASVAGVVAPVAMDFQTPSCLLTLEIPDDIVAMSNTVLKKMVVKASGDHPLTSDIAYEATYDIYTGKTTVVNGSGAREITMDFGANGYELSAGYTPVTVLIAPFTVPEGGLRVEFTDVDGATNTVPLLANQAGTSYAAGEVISQTLSSSSDGIIPCTSPVEWPIGYRDGVGVFNTTTQPLWMTDHIWTASQPQATMTYEVSEDNPAPVKIEVNNFVQYNYSSGCVKGSWTGDYFEFDVPVRNFKAGTEVTLTLPTYGRGAPLFWDVYYLDGEEWKCDRYVAHFARRTVHDDVDADD
ncbi:MAG: fimbrillin family protein [Alistipes shahii]